ncbi:MAG: hypothetical protein C0501_02060 [Isosphaera sp.]|nr:hypothetical protein [Isosphaera sp.]
MALPAAVVVLGAAAGFAAWFFLIHEPEPRTDLERFRGDWQIAVGGRTTPNVVTVAGDRWESSAAGVAGRAYRITLNEAADPKEIDLDPVDVANLVGRIPKLHGVYAFDGRSTVRVRVGDTTEPRPRTLDDPDHPGWVLTRVKVEPAPRR